MNVEEKERWRREKKRDSWIAFLVSQYSYMGCKVLILQYKKRFIWLLFDLVFKISLREIIVNIYSTVDCPDQCLPKANTVCPLALPSDDNFLFGMSYKIEITEIEFVKVKGLIIINPIGKNFET